jgi:hypothetical protein
MYSVGVVVSRNTFILIYNTTRYVIDMYSDIVTYNDYQDLTGMLYLHKAGVCHQLLLL